MKKFLAVVCILIIVGLFPVLLLGTVAKYRLLNATAFKQIVHISRVGDYVPQLIAQRLADQTSHDNDFTTSDNPFAQAMNPALIEELVGQALTPDTVYVIVDQVIDTLAAWWHTDQPIENIPLVIHLNLGTDIAHGLLGNLFGGLDIPTDINVQEILQKRAAEDPAQWKMLNERATQLRRWAGLAKQLLWTGWGVIGLCLISLILLRHRPFYSVFGWLGWTHLFMALSSVPAIAGVWITPQLVTPWINTSTDTSVLQIVEALLNALTQRLVWPMVWVSAGILALGIIWLVVCLIVKANTKPKPAPSQAATPAPTPKSAA